VLTELRRRFFLFKSRFLHTAKKNTYNNNLIYANFVFGLGGFRGCSGKEFCGVSFKSLKISFSVDVS
jgi:hypothetical protein